MVGKLDINQGENYKFWPKLAKEVAEGQGGGGGTGGGSADGVYGPYTRNGTKYWIQKEGTKCWVWFDTDPDTDPDVRMDACAFVADENNDILLRQAVQAKMEALGCQC